MAVGGNVKGPGRPVREQFKGSWVQNQGVRFDFQSPFLPGGNRRALKWRLFHVKFNHRIEIVRKAKKENSRFIKRVENEVIYA